MTAMAAFADLAQQARDALVADRPELLSDLVDRNFDLRQSICQLPREHVQMVQIARESGRQRQICRFGWCHHRCVCDRTRCSRTCGASWVESVARVIRAGMIV